jgi:hypothetical protein
MSTSTAMLCPAATSNGKALRFSPTIGSTSGISASGHQPAAPSPPVGVGTLISASRYSTTSRPAIAWPLPSFRLSSLMLTPEAGPVTTTWKDSNSLRAAASVAEVGALAGTGACGRTLVAPLAVHTCAARAAEGSARANAPARIEDHSALLFVERTNPTRFVESCITPPGCLPDELLGVACCRFR